MLSNRQPNKNRIRKLSSDSRGDQCRNCVCDGEEGEGQRRYDAGRRTLKEVVGRAGTACRRRIAPYRLIAFTRIANGRRIACRRLIASGRCVASREFLASARLHIASSSTACSRRIRRRCRGGSSSGNDRFNFRGPSCAACAGDLGTFGTLRSVRVRCAARRFAKTLALGGRSGAPASGALSRGRPEPPRGTLYLAHLVGGQGVPALSVRNRRQHACW